MNISYPKWWGWVAFGIPVLMGAYAMSGVTNAAGLAFFYGFISWFAFIQIGYVGYWLLRKGWMRITGVTPPGEGTAGEVKQKG